MHLRRRVSLVAVIRLSIGMVLFGVLWTLIVGRSREVGGVALAGLLLFLVFEAWYAGEMNLANSATNARIDPLVPLASEVEDLRREAAELRRMVGAPARDDAPPRGTAVSPREDAR
jgi:hypothetical protein